MHLCLPRNLFLQVRYMRFRTRSKEVPDSPSVSGNSITRDTTHENNEKRRALQVAVIGTPNVGKSAITNCLVKSDVCAVSKLIDTTRSVGHSSLDLEYEF